MQRVQNLAAKVILGKLKMDSASECLLVLHWLPICSRINHKILTLVHKCIMGSAMEYLQNLLVVHRASRPGLRSALDTNPLVVPFVRCKTFAECSFSVQGPKMWNSLQKKIKNSPILSIAINIIMLVKLNFKLFSISFFLLMFHV